MENLNIWKFLINSTTNFRWIAIDLPGHGKSINLSEIHTMELMAEQVFEVLNKLDVHEFYLVGHSMGGYVSLAMMEQKPDAVKGFVSFFSHPFDDSEEKRNNRLSSVEVIEKNKEDFIRITIPNLFRQDKLSEYQNEIQEAKRMAMDTSKEGIIAAQRGMAVRKDRSLVLKEIRIPTLFLFGEYDQLIHNHRIIEDFQNLEHIRLQSLPIGHNGQWEAPDECREIIINYLNNLSNQYH